MFNVQKVTIMTKIKWSKDRPQKPDVDPMLSDLREALNSDKRSMFAKANVSGLAPATIKRIQEGITRRPQGVTYFMAYKMLGYRLTPVPDSGKITHLRVVNR